MKPFDSYNLPRKQRLYVCQLCGDIFSRRELLRKHLLGKEKQSEEATGFLLEQASRITAGEVSDLWHNTEGSRYADFLKKIYPPETRQEHLPGGE